MLILEFPVYGKIVQLVHVLQEPQVIVQLGCLLAIAHCFAQVQILQVNRVQVHIFSFVLLWAELRLLERGHEWHFSEVLHCVFNADWGKVVDWLFLLLVLVFYLADFVVEVLPCDIRGLFLVRRTKGLLALNDRKFLFLHGCFLLQKIEDICRFLLNHLRKVVHSMFSHGSLLGVVLESQHLANYGLLKDLNWL